MKKYRIVSLFAGCGGLDLGFNKAGFDIVWANEYDKAIWETYELNHPHTKLDKRSIIDIPSEEIPDCDGIIGGPPCQSWSLAGAMRGEKDPRGQLFYEYIRILKDKKPLFFLAENVPGIISSTHKPTFDKLITEFGKFGYTVRYALLDARNYGVPQERRRVIIVGYQKKLNKFFQYPAPTHAVGKEDRTVLFKDTAHLKRLVTLKEAIGDLPDPVSAKEKNKTHAGTLEIPNHEYMNGGFSTIFMSRNRKREWYEASFTIQAGGRHAPLHPASAKMIKVGEDNWKFDDKTNIPYRRLSVRECARIQTFPDNFIFKYNSIADGYKMIGNAVPVLLAKVVAEKIKEDLKKVEGSSGDSL